MLETVALWLLVVAFLKLFLFHLALSFGVQWGQIAYGETYSGKLPNKLRSFSVFISLLSLALAGHYLAEIGVFESLLDSGGRVIANWAFFGLISLAALVNNFWWLAPERRLWGPIAIVMAVSALIVAL